MARRRVVPSPQVAARLRRQRERCNWEQQELAARAGVSRSSVSYVEACKQAPTVEFLAAVVPVLWPTGGDAVLRELMLTLGYPVPGLYLRSLDGSEDGDPLAAVELALARGPWPARVVQGVTLLLEPWVVDSSGRRVAVEGG